MDNSENIAGQPTRYCVYWAKLGTHAVTDKMRRAACGERIYGTKAEAEAFRDELKGYDEPFVVSIQPICPKPDRPQQTSFAGEWPPQTRRLTP
jgi:hypothetical protein